MNQKVIIALLTCVMQVIAGCGNTDAVNAHEPLPEAAAMEQTIDDTFAALTIYKSLLNQLSVNQNEKSQYEMNFMIEMDMMLNGFPIAAGWLDGNLKMIKDTDLLEIAMFMDMRSMGSGLRELYYDGNRIYYAIDGVELPIDFDFFMKQIDASVSLPDFYENAVKSLEITDVDGDVEYTMLIDNMMISDFVASRVNDSLFELEIEIDREADFRLDDVKMIILADKNGQPLHFAMEIKMSKDIDDFILTKTMRTIFDIIKWD